MVRTFYYKTDLYKHSFQLRTSQDGKQHLRTEQLKAQERALPLVQHKEAAAEPLALYTNHKIIQCHPFISSQKTFLIIISVSVSSSRWVFLQVNQQPQMPLEKAKRHEATMYGWVFHRLSLTSRPLTPYPPWFKGSEHVSARTPGFHSLFAAQSCAHIGTSR